VLAAVLVAALLGGGVYWYLSSRPVPEETADAYVAAWTSGDYSTLDQWATSSEASAFYTEVAENLGVGVGRGDHGGKRWWTGTQPLFPLLPRSP